MQSGRRASSAATSFVARNPSGGRPHSSPASRPTLSAPCANTPISSSAGCVAIARNARRPTLPVVHCTTRRRMRVSGDERHVLKAAHVRLVGAREAGLVDLPVGPTRGELLHRDTRLEPRERLPDADVLAVAEVDLAIGL